MSNQYFQFKQFRINQDKTAMKVCTDSCIFGAFANPDEAKNILDIGTGTGLLALMIAQKSNAFIDAVEIEDSAFEQASENIQNSKWESRIKIFHNSIQKFSEVVNKKYDYIISNPPFFIKQLKSSNLKKNIAHHNEQLSFSELVQAVSVLLEKNGKFDVILPPEEYLNFTAQAIKKELYPNRVIEVKDKESLPVFRIISSFTFIKPPEINKSEFIIKNNNGEYTFEFKELLKDYYLHL